VTVLLAPPALDGNEVRFITVAVLAPVPHPLTYLVPPGMPVPPPGARVLCPLGNREVTGLVVAPAPGHPDGVRPISEVLDTEPLFSPDLMETLKFCSEYYLAPMGEVARAALPPGMAPRSAKQWRITPSGRLALQAPLLAGVSTPEQQVLAMLEEKPRSPVAIQKALGISAGRLARLGARGLVEEATEMKGSVRLTTETFWDVVKDGSEQPLPSRSPSVMAVDAYLRSVGSMRQEDLSGLFPQVTKHLKKLEQLGRVKKREMAAPAPDPYEYFPTPRAPLASELTNEQRSAIDHLHGAVESATFRAFLLEGVTGSGKTEVYLNAIARVRQLGRTALILVPEIALTPSLAARFRGRVDGGVAVLHSGVTPSERRAAYDAARSGRVGAVLGARSAVFAPLWNPGIIIVDEEHDGSYKQDETPRYHGRDLALFRARAANAVCILGSATPSLESVHGAIHGRLEHLQLTMRPNSRPLPQVHLIDLRKKRGPKKPGDQERQYGPMTAGAKVAILSDRLRTAVAETLARKEQVLIFLNRRGYSSSVHCTDCGLAISCPNCTVSLTHHASKSDSEMVDAKPIGLLRCHYCDFHQHAPETCPSCQSTSLRALGLGIQRVEAEIAAQFPSSRIGRLDRDSVRGKGMLEKTLTSFASGELDILVGTQMLAKGHDYPGVTLVGVVAADISLRMPDWRAAERTLQLLTQVAGRAGRGDLPGQVLIQTYSPEHTALQCAARHDVKTFAEAEMLVRQELGYPPFSRLCLIRAESRDEKEAMALAQRAAALLRQAATTQPRGSVHILGPAPAPLARLKEIWRFQILVKSSNHSHRAAVLQVLRREMNRIPSTCRLILDVDPGAVI